MLRQETQSAACAVVNGCHRKRDEEVKKDAQDVDGWAAVKNLASQKGRRDDAPHPKPEQDGGLCKVQSSGNQAAAAIAVKAFVLPVAAKAEAAVIVACTIAGKRPLSPEKWSETV